MISPHRVTAMSVLLLAIAFWLANEAAAIGFSSETSNVDGSDCYGLKLQVGKFSLQPGSRKVSFMIRGKYQQSTGYFVGIDQIRFYPAGAP